MDAAGRKNSRRESNKAHKRERIVSAARTMFTRHDYPAATMRQIAAHAHVGLGTLFSYADDKRDLVFLVFNDDLAAVTERALRAPRPGQALIVQLMAVFGPHYRHFGRHPALSRLALQELTFYSRGKQAAAFQEIRSRLLQALEGLMRAAQRSGALRPDVPAARLARMVFLVYSAAVRLWIAQPEPRPASGLLELRKLLSLALEGMSGAAARPG